MKTKNNEKYKRKKREKKTKNINEIKRRKTRKKGKNDFAHSAFHHFFVVFFLFRFFLNKKK